MKKSIFLAFISLASFANANANTDTDTEITLYVQNSNDTVKVATANGESALDFVGPEALFPRKSISGDRLVKQDLLITDSSTDMAETVAELLLVTQRDINEGVSVTESVIPEIMPLKIYEFKDHPQVIVKKKGVLSDAL